MRILTVLTDLGYRGTQRAAQNYSVELCSRGHAVAVLAVREGGPRVAPLRERGIDVWIGGDDLDQALGRARSFKPDIIHVHRSGLAQAIWGRVFNALKTPDNRLLETNVFGRVDYSDAASFVDVHLQISRWCLYRWKRWLGSRPSLGAYLPYPVDTQVFREVTASERELSRSRASLPTSSFICGRIGKWHPALFEAFAELVRRVPDALLLNVCDHRDAQEYAAALPAHVRERLVAVPKLDGDEALAAFYASLDALLQVSPIGETFGMVLAESMACGTPVVTASTPVKDNAQVEVVSHGEGGVVSGSLARLPQALFMLQQDHAMRQRCQQNAHRLIATRYALPIVAAQFEKIATLCLSSNSKADLRARLEADAAVVTDIGASEIQQLLQNTVGGTSLMQHLGRTLVHNPVLYQMYAGLRGVAG